MGPKSKDSDLQLEMYRNGLLSEKRVDNPISLIGILFERIICFDFERGQIDRTSFACGNETENYFLFKHSQICHTRPFNNRVAALTQNLSKSKNMA